MEMWMFKSVCKMIIAMKDNITIKTLEIKKNIYFRKKMWAPKQTKF